MLDKNSKIYVAGHNGLVGSAIWNNLKSRGYNNLIGRSHKELDLTDQNAVKAFFAAINPNTSIDITDWYVTNASPVANSEGWTVIKGTAGSQWAGNTYDAANGVAEFWSYAGSTIKQTLTLPAGDFKLTTVALTRTDMTGYVFAGKKQVNLATVASDEVNNRADAATWFAAGNGVNEVPFTMAEAGDIEIGITTDTETGDHWTVWQSFKLELIPGYADMTITDAKYATFCAPFEVTVPEGVTAATVTGVDGSKLVFGNELTTIPANTPVVLYSETTVDKTFYGKPVEGTPEAGLLTGVYAETEAPVGSYVLQNNTTENLVAFFYVGNDFSQYNRKVGANRAYLTVPNGGSVKAYFLGEDTDGIRNVEGETGSDAIYNLSGQRVSKAQRGLYIVNGKVVVK